MRLGDFDYSSPAELYVGSRRRGGRQSIVYRRFDSAALAIRYTIEELQQGNFAATTLEVNGERYRHLDIRRLYDSGRYPLQRSGAHDEPPPAKLRA